MEEFRCSFCGKERRKVSKLITGPRVFICDECVGVCVDVLLAQEADSPHEACSFCGEPFDEVARVVPSAAQGAHICDQCVILCVDICAEEDGVGAPQCSQKLRQMYPDPREPEPSSAAADDWPITIGWQAVNDASTTRHPAQPDLRSSPDDWYAFYTQIVGLVDASDSAPRRRNQDPDAGTTDETLLSEDEAAELEAFIEQRRNDPRMFLLRAGDVGKALDTLMAFGVVAKLNEVVDTKWRGRVVLFTDPAGNTVCLMPPETR